MRLFIFGLLVTQLAFTDIASTNTVRVAASQCPSEMGATAANVENVSGLVRKASAQGAKIVVLPECVVQGYMDPLSWISWQKSKEAGKPQVAPVAETIPGPVTRQFGELAKELGIYLCLGLIEVEADKFDSSQVLFSPTGQIVAHHRKQSLWMPGEATWCTAGERPVQVVDTEYGRLGLMICHDFHKLPPKLKEHGADIVLYSVGWYGPNEKNWFENVFPRRAVIPYDYHIVVANWSAASPDARWPGQGFSCIITKDGKTLAAAKTAVGNEIVVTNLAVKHAKLSGKAAPAR